MAVYLTLPFSCRNSTTPHSVVTYFWTINKVHNMSPLCESKCLYTCSKGIILTSYLLSKSNSIKQLKVRLAIIPLKVMSYALKAIDVLCTYAYNIFSIWPWADCYGVSHYTKRLTDFGQFFKAVLESWKETTLPPILSSLNELFYINKLNKCSKGTTYE